MADRNRVDEVLVPVGVRRVSALLLRDHFWDEADALLVDVEDRRRAMRHQPLVCVRDEKVGSSRAERDGQLANLVGSINEAVRCTSANESSERRG